MIDAKTLGELENLCTMAIAAADTFSEAVKTQAEQHQREPVALRRYVTARVRDTLAKQQKQAADFEQFCLEFGGVEQ